MFNYQRNLTLLLPFLMVFMVGCSDDDDDIVINPPIVVESTEYSYEVTVLNLTHGQPLSPIAAVLHSDAAMWMIGEPASESLELLAESGDNTDFMAETAVLSSASNEAVVMPGTSATITLSTTDAMATHLTIVSMLVNTNDAFSGLTGVDLSSFVVDAPQSWTLGVYDAGTELNSELAGTIPGPADGGAGYDIARDDVDFVAMHPGIVSIDDGLTDSVLSQAHRIDNPAIKLTITRIK